MLGGAGEQGTSRKLKRGLGGIVTITSSPVRPPPLQEMCLLV